MKDAIVWLSVSCLVAACGGDDDGSVDAGNDAGRSDGGGMDAFVGDSGGVDGSVVEDAGTNRNVVVVKWTADSLDAETPTGRTCTLVDAELDTVERSEGVSSMRFTSPVGDVQGSMGCTDFEQTPLGVDWNGGEWLCMYFDMKVDGAFEWNVNQNKLKMQRMVNSGNWTMYLNDDGVDISECPTCDDCTGGDRCSVLSYDMRPSAAGGTNPVESWQSYTIGIRMESAAGADDGEMRLWVNGALVDSLSNETYCDSCSGEMVGAWGTFGMNPYPQSPDGTLWLDDFVMMTGPDECIPRS